jgi:3-oxoacyl-(acyl-carrier-protein) synthase
MSARNRCVITGLGLAAPAGCTPESHWETLSRGQPLFEVSDVFGTGDSGLPVSRVREPGFEPGVTRRQARKLDRFTLLAMAAVRGALRDARLSSEALTRETVGMVIGNSLGGWGYVEPMMYGLYSRGMESINAYVATAWFPAAAQGEISIQLGIRGYSKTVSADRVSAGVAIIQATRCLEAGRLEVVLAGGAEAPLTPLILNAHLQAHGLDVEPLGEGAAFLVIEKAEQARARGAREYAEVLGTGQAASLHESMRACLHAAGVAPVEVDAVMVAGPSSEVEEWVALRELFGGRSTLRVTSPRTLYGDTLAASMALDVASACLCLERQALLPSSAAWGEASAHHPFQPVVGSVCPARLRRVLVNGRDSEGRGVSLLLGRTPRRAVRMKAAGGADARP